MQVKKKRKKKKTEIGQREAACQLQLTSFSAASKGTRAPGRFRSQSGNCTRSQNTEPGLFSKESKSASGSFPSMLLSSFILSVASRLVRKFQSAVMHGELEDVRLCAAALGPLQFVGPYDIVGANEDTVKPMCVWVGGNIRRRPTLGVLMRSTLSDCLSTPALLATAWLRHKS